MVNRKFASANKKKQVNRIITDIYERLKPLGDFFVRIFSRIHNTQ